VEYEKVKDYRAAYLTYKKAAEELDVILWGEQFKCLTKEISDLKLFCQRLFRTMALNQQLAKESIENIILQHQDLELRGVAAFTPKTLPTILTLTDQILFNANIFPSDMEESPDASINESQDTFRLDHSDDEDYLRELDALDALEARDVADNGKVTVIGMKKY
jgi:hypothetical protein